MAKPSAKKVQADRDRLQQHLLEEVLGTFMQMDGAQAVKQMTDMFGERPVLEEYKGQRFDVV